MAAGNPAPRVRAVRKRRLAVGAGRKVARRAARVEDVLTALRGAFARNGWHGPTVLESIAGLTEEQAAARPEGVHHSGLELVRHIEYWEAMALRYLEEGGPPRNRPADWAEANTSFADSVRLLQSTHRRLVRAVARLRERDLDRLVATTSGPRRTLSAVLHGVAAHDAYHAGQIRLVRTLGGR